MRFAFGVAARSTSAFVPTTTILLPETPIACATRSEASTVNTRPLTRTRSARGCCARSGTLAAMSRQASEARRILEILGLVLRFAADHRADDLDVLDLVRANGVRIVGENDEIGELAGGDRPLERFLVRCPRAVERVDSD